MDDDGIYDDKIAEDIKPQRKFHPIRKSRDLPQKQLKQKQLELIHDIEARKFELDLEKEEDKAKFVNEYGDCFTGGGNGTLIHLALHTCDDDNFDHLKPLFKFMVGKYPTLLETRDMIGDTTLHSAIQND